ncbi:hypothetical protein H4Q26_000178 [Puccinia striiformis f. sp. tritici PST-130]|nr:hypothetical protein H4Q26_000178 [Puccinia striiformis f. sp. tritici PST-130]
MEEPTSSLSDGDRLTDIQFQRRAKTEDKRLTVDFVSGRALAECAKLHGRKSIARKESIAIVVLGDIGRSPRMMRHALSFADQQWYVSIFAYKGSAIRSTQYFMKSIERGSNCLFSNPPAIPTLPIVQLVRLLLGSKLIIDWHNTAYSILALKFGSDRHPMVVSPNAEKQALSEMWHLRFNRSVGDVYPIKKKIVKGAESLPKLMCLITGKGPLKEYYLEIISKKSKEEGWEDVGIVCQSVWFDDPEDYRKILGAASWYQSSSELFWLGSTESRRYVRLWIAKLVKHGQNGLVFDSAIELSGQLEVSKRFGT